LITGASSGIGEAFARLLAAKKKPLVLLGRNDAKLKALAEELRGKEGIDVRFLSLDLARSKELPLLPGKLQNMGIKVDVLINSAGFGKYGTEDQVRYEDALNMVNLNCRATLAMCKLFLPGMQQRKKGAIINLGDLDGFFPVPRFATYAATKSFVISYTQALSQEIGESGIKVLCACPGPTASAFHATARINPSRYKRLKHLNDPQTIAEESLEALKQGKSMALVGKIPWLTKLAVMTINCRWLQRYGRTLFREGMTK
jgi:short-subunit dehydrogenase